MLTYLALNTIFLSIAAVLYYRFRPATKAVVWTLVLLLVLTLIFDNLMIWADFFSYNQLKLLGINIGLAPLEDFAYPIAAAFGVPALWTVLEKRRS